MISFFTSVEFYIILAVIAAAIVAFSARPTAKGPASEFLMAGDLRQGMQSEAQITLTCLDNGKVRLLRQGLPEVRDDGAVSLACKLVGTDVFIEERIVPGRSEEILNVEAEFVFKWLRPGRYHIRYNSQPTGTFAAFPFHVAPGISTTKALHQ